MTFVINDYPLGPNVRDWLNISHDQYRGHQKSKISESERESVTNYLVEFAQAHRLDEENKLVDVVDELVAMGLARAALAVVDSNSSVWNTEVFRGVLSEGIAAMLLENLERAEHCFVKAQSLIPEEPGPYINLIKIMLHMNRDDEAIVWCETGLEAEPNNHTLWEMFHEILYYSDRNNLESRFEAKITELNSWSGASLMAAIKFPDNHEARLNALKPFLEQGANSEEFLIEYTGALGAAGRFEEIAPIVWFNTSNGGKQPSWKLEIHGIQSYLAMGKTKEFMTACEKLLKRKDLTDDVIAYINQLMKEEQEHIH